MNKLLPVLVTFAVNGAFASGAGPASRPSSFLDAAPTPPMGWNSWDCWGTQVTEAQTKANADYMAEHLKAAGYQYVVVDIQWYEPRAKGHDYRQGAELAMDAYGRLLPAPNRFPSSAGDQGFRPLADYVHAKGLKFGVHLLRGIPRQAVARNTPILGTSYHAADVADRTDVCKWNSDMYGVDMTKPGAQAYYESVFALLAGWGVDFVKVDDLSAPDYHAAEVEAIRRAIDKTGRPMVLSTSPGATPLARANHVASHANMWRMSNDFWDSWPALKEQFDRCRDWAPFIGRGHWPDADMLPLGRVRAFQRKDNWTHFTADEQRTLMTLWAIARSPLILGGDLPQTDGATLRLVTNRDVLAVDQRSTGNRELLRRPDGLIVWTADIPGAPGERYLAFFNTSDGRITVADLTPEELGLPGAVRWRNLWTGGEDDQHPPSSLAPHACVLYRVTPRG